MLNMVRWENFYHDHYDTQPQSQLAQLEIHLRSQNKMVIIATLTKMGPVVTRAVRIKTLLGFSQALCDGTRSSKLDAGPKPPPPTTSPTNTDTTADSLTKGADPRLSRKRLIAGLVLVVVGLVIALIGAGPLRDGLSSSVSRARAPRR